VIRSGTVELDTAGEGGAPVLERVPRCRDVVALLDRLVQDDDDRAAAEAERQAHSEADGADDGTTVVVPHW
jgi:hypothetical protein